MLERDQPPKKALKIHFARNLLANLVVEPNSKWFELIGRGMALKRTLLLNLAVMPLLYATSATAQETAAEFKAETNLVLVPVVVRNGKGEVVFNLTKQDFRLFDNGREQMIDSFSVDDGAGRVAEDRGESSPSRASRPMIIPQRYVALVFDDLDFRIGGINPPPGFIGDVGDLWFARDAARKMLATLKPADRVAVVTSSATVLLDFTADRSKVEGALMRLRFGDFAPHPAPGQMMHVCEDTVRRMALLPGQRTLVFISPGLLLGWSEVPETNRLTDEALRARVIINSIDARGLSPDRGGRFQDFQMRVTDGTGGTFIRDTNDLKGGMERLAAAPKCMYILGFSPKHPRLDGSFHHLTVELKEGHGFDVQARSGYYDGAPPLEKAAATAKATLQFSETESMELAKALDIRPPTPVMDISTTPPAPTAAATPPVAAAKSDEMVTTEQPVTFKVQTNLVEVPVILRDSSGRAIGDLKQEEFHLFDKGKRQEIAKFAIVVNGGGTAPAVQTSMHPNVAAASTAAPTSSGPTAALSAPAPQFVTFVFDDLHMLTSDIQQVRAAALKYLRMQLRPGDRVSLVTTSGRQSVDFTGDPESLAAAMNQIMPSPLAEKTLSGCGAYLSYFQAAQIEREVGLHPTRGDVSKSLALRVAMEEYTDFDTAVMAIRDAYTSGLAESRNTLAALKAVVRRMVSVPGERSVVLISPGFFVPFDLQNESDDLMAQAIRAKVLISVVDARGVWTNPALDACRSTASQDLARFRDLEGHANMDELIAIAEDTGGSLNVNNDFLGGIEKAAAVPEYRYILGFVPQNLKLDGSFHPLKVRVVSGEKLTLQARRGYWAPKHAEDEAAVASQEIEDAVFSRDETLGLAAEMHTRVTRAGDQSKLSVLASLDLKAIHLRKADDRDRNDLSIVVALFDTDGNFIEGTQKLLQLRLRDETVSGLAQKPPAVLITDFVVKPGDYLVRMVVRDAEERHMTAENAAVRVP